MFVLIIIKYLLYVVVICTKNVLNNTLQQHNVARWWTKQIEEREKRKARILNIYSLYLCVLVKPTSFFLEMIITKLSFPVYSRSGTRCLSFYYN